MKSLLESLLDDEETITGTLVEEQIEKWLKENCKITGTYKIFQEDDTYYVDVNGGVIITNKDIERFPTELFRFNIVKGSFKCSSCIKLISLEGGPKKVGSNFYCDNCDNLTSLKGAPKKIGRGLYCRNCKKLESLEGYLKNPNSKLFITGCDLILQKFTIEQLKKMLNKENIIV